MDNNYRNAMSIAARDPRLFAKTATAGLVFVGILTGYAAVPFAQWAYSVFDPLPVLVAGALFLSALRVAINIIWAKKTARNVTEAVNSTNAANAADVEQFREATWEEVAKSNPMASLVTILVSALATATAMVNAPTALSLSRVPDTLELMGINAGLTGMVAMVVATNHAKTVSLLSNRWILGILASSMAVPVIHLMLYGVFF